MSNLRGTAVAPAEHSTGLLGALAATGRRIDAWLLAQGRMAVHDLRNVPRYLLRTLLGAVILCGLLSLWEARGDGKIPGMSPLQGPDPYCISSAGCVAARTDAETRWQGLSPALVILDQVNPTVAAWVRKKHDSGGVVFYDDYRAKGEPTAAESKYGRFSGRLVINRQLFCENDGTIAAILCHEYRHSRQNLGKYARYVLSFLFAKEGDLSIMENDAVIYEQEARTAIFGAGASKTLELAAWQRWVRRQDQSPQPGAGR